MQVSDKCYAPAALLLVKNPGTWSTWLFLGVKFPGRGVDHPSQSCAEVKGGAIPLRLLWALMIFCGVNLPFFTFKESRYPLNRKVNCSGEKKTSYSPWDSNSGRFSP
jgi:hypothetical protein